MRQRIYIFCVYSISFLDLYIETSDINYLKYYLVSVLCINLVIILTPIIYKRANRLIINNMCMLLSIGFVMICRLSFDKAVRQFVIAMFAIIISSFIPFIISKGPFFSKFKWTYAICGIVLLLFVLIFSVATNGAKLSITIFSVTFQPSEFVKVIFVFAMASFLAKANGFRDIVVATSVAAAHVLVLVCSKDLGGAVILFVVYICMLYVATCNVFYLLLGALSGSFAALVGYKLFSHVRVRVNAFIRPFETIENAGYQIAQSLFAICTGGFWGLGLKRGMPNTIPVVASDFIYSAICEEFGGVFGICLILICLSSFILIMNIAMKFSNSFYKYVAVGLGVTYVFQVLLTIGGVTKFIPLTGVTLPFVSYGGTSILVTVFMFAIVQGLYIGRNDIISEKS